MSDAAPMQKLLPNGLPPTGIDVLPFIADSVICTDDTGRILLFNKAAERSFGYLAAEMLDQDIGILLPHRFREKHVEQIRGFALGAGTADRLMGGQREVWGLRKNGEEFPAEASISRHTFDGRTILTVVHRDVTERKELEDQREAIAHEMNHRIKNVISVVNALVSITAKSAQSVEEFKDSLQERLGGLAATQSFLGRNMGQMLNLDSLLQAELAHYQGPEGANLQIAGVDVTLSAAAVQPLALAFHELATNSAKYGALSEPRGCVSITTDFISEGPERLLAIEWRETGGPPVQPPEEHGFGTLLIEQMIKRVFQGDFKLDFRPEGLVCRMAVPTDKLE